MNRSLIKIKQMFEIVTMGTDSGDKSPTTINRANKARMYSMDLSILKCIEAGMNEKDKEEADAVVVKRIVYLLSNLLKDDYSDAKKKYSELMQFEGNIWAALTRLEQKSYKGGYKLMSSSISETNTVFKKQEKTLRKGIWEIAQKAYLMTKEKNNLQANASLQRNNTYMIKKRDMMDSCFADESQTDQKDALKSNNQNNLNNNEELRKMMLMKSVANILCKDISREDDKIAKEKKKEQIVTRFAKKILGFRHTTNHDIKDDVIEERNETESAEDSFKSDSNNGDIDEEKESEPKQEDHTPTISMNSKWDKVNSKSLRDPERKLKEIEISFEDSLSESSPRDEVEHRLPEEQETSKENENSKQLKILGQRSKTVAFKIDTSKEEEKSDLMRDTKKVVYEIKPHDQMMILFGTILLQCNQFEVAIKVLDEIGLESCSDILTHANALRLLCLIDLKFSKEKIHHTSSYCERAIVKNSRVK